MNLKPHTIRCLFLLLPILLFSACGNLEDRKGGQGQTRSQLNEAYLQLARELHSYAGEKGLARDPRVLAADLEAVKASRVYAQTRKDHPDLQSFYEKQGALQEEVRKARVNEDKEAYQQAKAELKRHQEALEKAAAPLPEIQKAREEMDAEIDKQLLVLAQVVAESGPEGKALAEKFIALQKRIQSLN